MPTYASPVLLVSATALCLMTGCQSTPDTAPPSQDPQDEGKVGLFSAPLKNDPDQPGVVEAETPRQGAPETEGEEEGDAHEREWFVAPIPSFNPQTEYGLTVLGGHIFSLDPDDEETPPSVASLGGFYTSNESGGAFAAFRGYLPGDRWRVLAAGGSVALNYDFYGVGEGEDGNAIPVRTEGDLITGELLRRVSEGLYVGPTVTLAETSSRIRGDNTLPPEIDPGELRVRDNALGLHVQRDTRDDVFYPREGSLFDLEAKFFDTSWGSDLDYQIYEVPFSMYHAVSEEAVLAWQVKYQQSAGDTPFYRLPTWDGRGYERGRYRDEVVLGAQAEYRHSLTKRFGGAVFGGVGSVAPGLDELDDAVWLPAAGFGVRIKLTEKNQLEYRIDVAWGRDGFNYYLSVGQAF